jgi:putrescine aminotransferase
VERVAAFIAEPIMGAGGVVIPPDTYWPSFGPGLKERGVLMISDEVICGFGRTGSWFGCETYGTEPDFMTMAKALTSGYVPMGAVAVSDRVADVLVAKGEEFTHGYTYSGHPAAAAAALANLAILQRGAPAGARGRGYRALPGGALARLADHPIVGEAVMTGLVGAVQLCADKGGPRGVPGEGRGWSDLPGAFDCRGPGDARRGRPDGGVAAAGAEPREADLLVERARIALDRTEADARRLGLM